MAESEDGTRKSTLERGGNCDKGVVSHVQAHGRRTEPGHGEADDEQMSMKEYKTSGNNVFRIILSGIIVICCLIALTFLLFDTGENEPMPSEENPKDMVRQESKEELKEMESVTQDPQEALGGNMGEEEGCEISIEKVLSANTVEETDGITYGIDVSRYQGSIDYQKVAESGIQFVMVRIGYRDMISGEIEADANAKYNLQEAGKQGLHLGAYFFSSAITEEEAVEEAQWVADYISQYQITYPVAYDCEGFESETSRQYSLTKNERSDIAIAFLNRIYELGYTPMFYASRNGLLADYKWNTSLLESKYRMWVAQYPNNPGEKPDYSGKYSMWQYSNQGTVPGIFTKVDLNIAYFGYVGAEDAKDPKTPEDVTADPEAFMTFTQVEDIVTAKEECNLRSIPSRENSTVVYTLKNGETVTRTGVSEAGWSRVVYNGQNVYVVTNLLTTDLAESEPKADDGLRTKFESCEDTVTAKIEVNLRSIPSVTNPDSVVVAVLHSGEYITRTGINKDVGWSRVDYNGQTLYCISSYLCQ